MKRIISLFSLFILLFVNIVTPVTYAMDGEEVSSESVSESTESSVDTDDSIGEGDDSSDTEASDDVESDEGTESDVDSEDSEADVTDEESSEEEISDEEVSDSTEGDEELEESLENSASSSTGSEASVEGVSVEEEIELLCKQEGAPENAHYLSSDDDASDVNCKWECDSHYALSEDGLSCTLVEESTESVVTDSKGNSEEVKSCEIPENAQKIENSNLTGEKCEWECSQGYLITKAGDACEEINFSKYKNEPSVDALCHKLGLSWAEEKGDLAKLAGIDDYVGSREQNESIRVYLVDHVEDILKGKFNIQKEVVEKNKGYVYTNDVVLNTEEIKGESTYNNITVNVEAPIGSFPEGTTLKIKPITKKKELKEIEDQIITQQDNVDETLELLAFDISFFYDEKEVQPVEGKTVQVTFDYAENKKLTEADSNENKELKVYHLNDKDENGNKVEEVEVKEVEVNQDISEEGKLAVDAEGFSVYVLTLVNGFEENGNITLVLNIGDGNLISDENNFTCENKTCKILVKSGNVVLPGASLEGKNFLGWYQNSSSYGEVAKRLGGAGDSIKIEADLTLQAMYGDVAVVWNNTGYDSLEAAINAVPANGADYSKIVILKDIELTSTIEINNGKKIELDLNGYTVSKGSEPFHVKGGKLKVSGSGLIQEDEDDKYAPIIIYGGNNANDVDYSEVIIGKDVTLKGRAGVFFRPENNSSYGAKLDFYGHAVCPTPQDDGEMTAGNCIYINGKINNTQNAPKIIIRNGATIESSIDGGVGIYGAGYGEWTIEDGATIIGNDSAIEIRAGELNIKGGTFKATESNCPASVVGNGNGSTTKGAALAIAQHTTKLPLKVKIDGGNFVGCAALSQSNPQNNTENDAKEVETIIQDGVFSGEVGNAFTGSDLTIMGGTFSSEPTKYVAEGYGVTKSDELYSVSYDPVAEVFSGETKIGGFSSLEKAFEEANSKDEAVIVLKKNHNVELPNRRLIAKGNIIFDLNNQILEINGNNSYCHINSLSGYITVDGGKLTIKQGTIDDKTSNQCYTHTIRVDNNAILNLENLTLKGDRSYDDNLANIALIRVDKGTLNIDSSEIISTKNFNVEVLQTSKITIKGNSNFKSNNTKYNGAINMNGSDCKAEIAGGIINVNSENKNLKLFNDGENTVSITGGTFNQDPSKWVADGYLVVAKEGSYDVVANNSLEEIDGNYMANPETLVSGTGIGESSTLKDLTVVVEENTGIGDDYITGTVNTGEIYPKAKNAIPLGQVVVKYKKDESEIKNVKFGNTIKVRIPVKDGFDKVLILAKHGDAEFGISGLATASGACNSDGEPNNNKYTGGLVSVVDGYASIYTCQASIFDAFATYYEAILDPNGANTFGTQKIYYAYGTKKYYTDDESEDSLLVDKKIVVPTKEGHKFMGYFNDKTKVIDSTGVILDAFDINENNTYIAQFDRGGHNFSYSGGSYVYGSTSTGTKYFNDSIRLIAPSVSDSRKEFKGWSFYSGDIDVTENITLTPSNCTDTCDFYMPNYDVKVQANIGEIDYKITYEGISGATFENGENPVSYTFSSEDIKLKNPSKSGHTFLGWSTGDNQNLFSGDESVAIKKGSTGSITFYANWSDEVYTVTIAVGGNTNLGKMEKSSLTGTYGTSISTGELFLKVGDNEVRAIPHENTSFYTYYFDGWTTDCGASLTDNCTFTGTFKATPKSYTVTYSFNKLPYDGVKLPESKTYEYGKKVTVSEKPSVAGFYFTGWFLDGELTGEFTMPDHDVVLTGEFYDTIVGFKIQDWLESVNGDNLFVSGALVPQTGYAMSQFKLTDELVNKTYTGYELSGSINDYQQIIAGDGSTTVNVFYKRSEYDVSYKYENAPSNAPTISTVKHKYKSTVEVPTVNVSGYDFSWNTGASFEMPAKDVVITGTFTPKTNTKYLVKYFGKNKNGADYLIEEVEGSGTTDTVATAIIKQYTGFTYNSGDSRTITSGNINGSGDLILKLFYDRELHTLHFDANEGTGEFADQVIPYELTGIKPTDPTRTGYDFTGWLISGTDIKYDFSNPVTGDINLVANWTPATGTRYTVEYYLQNLSGTDYELTGSATENLTGTTDSIVTGEQKVFSGFTFDEGNENNKPSGKITASGDLVLKLYYTRNTNTPYTVEYYLQNLSGTDYELTGSATENLTGTTDAIVTGEQKVFEGFTFSGENTNNLISGHITGSGDLVLKLYYDRDVHTITFDSNSGSAVETQTIRYNGTGTKPADPIRTGYDFTGWYLSGEIEEFDFTGTNITGNVSLVAKWEPKIDSYKVYYHLEKLEKHSDNDADPYNYPWRNESVIKEYSGIKVGSTIEVPQNITGYTLVTEKTPTESEKCTLEGDICNYTVDYSIKDIDFYYKRNPITIAFDSDGGTDVSPITNRYEYPLKESEVPVNPHKTGYVFSGWRLPNGEVKQTLSGYQLTENITLTGVWEEAEDTPYAVEYYLQELNGSYPETPNYTGDDLSGTTNAIVTGEQIVFPGFTFDETYEQNKLSGPITASGDLVLKLYYTRNLYDVSYALSGNLPGGEIKGKPETRQFKFGETVIVESGAAASGYTFSGWYLNDELAGEFIMPATGVVLTGWFNAVSVPYGYHYELEQLDGTFLQTGDVKMHGWTTGKPTGHPTQEELDTFTGTLKGFTLSGTLADYREPIKGDGKTNVAIKFKRNEYNLTYVYENSGSLSSNPSSLPETTGYKFESPVTLASLATASGYDFKWSGYDENEEFNMPANDVVITGVFTPRNDTPYTIGYYYEGTDGLYHLSGSVVRTGTTDSHTGVLDIDKISENPSYKFVESGSVLSGDIRGDGKLELKVYFKGAYTVNYIPGVEGIGWKYTTTGLDWGTQTPEPKEDPNNLKSPNGYIFDGWSPKWQSTVTGDVTYVAKWAPEDMTYNVEYYQENLNGEFEKVTTDKKTDKTNSHVEAEEKSFPGFTLDKTFEGTVDSGDVKGNGSLVLKLYYTRNSHKLTYNTPNGDSIEKEVKYGAKIPTPDIEYTGYEFGGFQNAPETMPDEDLTLTGDWNLKVYNVTFIGADIENLTYTIKSGINSLPTPVWTGYEFTGWYDENDENVTSILTGTYGDIKLTAKWNATTVNYTVKHYKEAWKDYDKNGKKAELASDGKYYYEDTSETLEGKADSQVSAKHKTSYKGFTFDEKAPNVTSGTVKADGSLELKFYYKRNTYTVTFNSDGGSTVTGQDVGFYLTPDEPENPTKEGYEFSGWTLSGDAYSFKNGYVEGNIELKANWTINEYTIAYELNSGEVATENPTSYSIESEDITLTNPTREGYDFQGWSGTAIDGLKDKVIIAKGSTENRRYEANWKATNYAVTFDKNGSGDDVASLTYTIESGINTLPTPVWTGYEFTGWYDGETKVESIPAGTGDITLKAHWEKSVIEYSVKHYREAWEKYPNKPVIEVDGKWYYEYTGKTLTGFVNDEVSVTPFAPTSGFVYNNEAANVTSGTLTVNGLELKLYYKRNMYTISFDTNEGTKVADIEVGYYLTGEKPTDPTRTGYVFSGWTLDNSAFNFAKDRVKTNITLVAEWTPNKYTVNFETAGAGTIDSITTGYDVEFALPTGNELSRTGYTFTGWSTVLSGDVEYTGGQTVSNLVTSGEITLYPVWEVNKYTITWLNSDGSLIKTGSYAYDTMPALDFVPVDPTVNVKGTFAGWTPEVVKVENNATYTATYTAPVGPAKYTVNWYNSNGELLNQTSVNYGDQASYTGDVPTSGENAQYNYVFKGWTLSGSEDILTEFPNIESDTAFVAKYDAILNSYDIVFEYTGANGSLIIESGNYLYGTETGALTIPTVTGYSDNYNTYVFDGWTPELSTVEGSVRYSAKYKADKREYIVSWKVGEDVTVSGYTYREKLVLPEEPSKTGYSFSGWEAQNDSPEAESGRYVEGDYNYVAQWNANTYKIEFNANDGTDTKVSQDMTYDLTGTLSGNTFQRAGYEFTGWSETADGAVKYANEEEVINLATSGTVELYAQRTLNKYTVTYNVNSGTMPETYTGTYSVLTGINPLAEPTRTGYVFSGWFDNEELSGDKVESIAVGSTGDKTFWAKWTPATGTEYKVEHRIENLDGTGLELLSTDDLTGATDDLTNAVARDLTGFALSGYVVQKTIAADGLTVVRIEYARKSYELTYYGNFAQPKKQQVKYGAEIPEPESTNNTGYVFNGFKNAPDSMPAENIVVKIDWAPATDTPYKVEHYLENSVGTGFDLVETDNLTGTTKEKTAAVAKDFTGFTLSGSVKQQTISATGATVVRVEYSRNSYELQYRGDYAQPKKQQVKYGAQIPEPEFTNRTGYVFGGFTKLDNKTDDVPADGKMPAKNLYLAINWVKSNNIPYKVEHYLENLDGTGFDLAETDNLTGSLGSGTLASEKDFTGFTLSGEVAQQTIETGGAVIRIEYSRNSYKLTYSGDYAQPKEQQVKYGAEIPAPESTNNTGYVYSGFLDAPADGKMPAKDIVVTIDWEKTSTIPYKVEHYLENIDGTGFELKDTDNLTGKIAELTEAEAKSYEGFTLSGEIAQQSILEDGTTVVRVEYSRNTYKLTYYGDMVESGSKTRDVKYGADLPAPESHIYTGHVFDGFRKNDKTDEVPEDGKMPAKNLYLAINWKKIEYNVSFNSDGGSAVTGQRVEFEENATKPDDPTKTGYQFSGWTLSGENFDFSTPITGDITLTGVWTPLTFNIKYVLNSGDNNSGNVSTFTVEDRVHLYDATRSGYVFDGWYTVDNISGSTKVSYIEKGTTTGQTLFAQWTPVKDAIDSAKSGDKTPVVSSDVTIDVAANSGDAEYKSGNIPTEIPIFDENLRTVVGSGEYEEYSLVGIERTITQTNNPQTDFQVNPADLDIRTGYVATIVGGLEVFVKKITRDLNGNIIDAERNTATVNFSKPVAIPIRIKTSATSVKIRVNHGEGYGLTGLSADMNTACNADGTATIPYTGGEIKVENSYAWIYTCSASAFVAYTETIKSNGGGNSGGSTGGGGGGGGGSSSSSSSSSSRSSSSSATPKTNTGNTSDINLNGVVTAPNKACLTVTEESKLKYNDEMLDAYAWAYANGVSSIDNIEKARLYSYITRAELAKIMVQYLAGVLHKQPVVNDNVSYPDVDSSLGEYANYIKLAYQYQIMGIHADGTPLEKFNPKGLVTRAEFASVFSRILYADKYNVDGEKYYSMHIDVLSQANIIKDTNPAILERIGWILLMIYRSSNDLPNAKKASDVNYCPISAEDEQNSAYEWALKYGITTIDDPDKARLGDGLTRAEFAKMMVQYMINVLHQKPILSEDISYPDVDGSLGDLESYIKLAYQYQIMGIHGNGEPLEEFEPNRIVTRKEFATVFSRILFGDRFNIDGPEYWTKHINALKEISVLKDGNPALQEVRGWVMLMMYRSAEDLGK